MNIIAIIPCVPIFLLVVWCFWLSCRVDKLEDEVDRLKNKKS